MADRIDLTIGDVTTAALIGVPAGAGPFPGVVATFHKGGLDGFTGWLVDELAANGYGAIAPDHYHALPEGVDAAQRRDYLTDEQMALDLEAAADKGAGREFAGHGSVNHSIKEYVRGTFHHTNTVESYFSILKRGITGNYQWVSAKHLKR